MSVLLVLSLLETSESFIKGFNVKYISIPGVVCICEHSLPRPGNVTGSCEAPSMGAGNQMQVLDDQPLLLATEPCLQPLDSVTV